MLKTMIAEIVMLTGRCEILVRKIYRKEALKYSAVAVFAKKLQDISGGHIPPHFTEDGIHFYYIHRGSLYFLASSTGDVSTIAVIEFLSRLYSITKDLCGIVNEESVRANFLPLFEMLCDSMDSGYVQAASTDRLKPFIQSQPVAVQRRRSTQDEVASRIFGIDSRVTPASAAHKPALGSAVDERAVYVDVVENLTVVTNTEGSVSHLQVNGTMSVKNLLQGQPTLRIAVNEDLQICKPGEVRAYGKSANLVGCNFHQNVHAPEFDSKRVLRILPPAGEFTALTYSVDSSSVTLPVLVTVSMTDIPNSRDKQVTMRASLNIPSSAVAVKIQVALPVPPCVTSAYPCELGPSESFVFEEGEKKLLWTIRKWHCAEKGEVRVQLVNHGSQAISKRDIGPAAVEFEISDMTVSGLHVRFIKVLEGNQPAPVGKFVRRLTTSESYTVNIS